MYGITKNREISWINDRLERVGEETRQHCADLKTYNCSTKMIPKVIAERVSRPIIRKRVQKRCRMLQDAGPATEVLDTTVH